MTNGIRYYVDVITVLAQKDFKIRYRNSVLGFVWSLLNPLASMLILTLVFGVLLRSTVPNFSAFILIGLLVWRFFSIGTMQGLMSIVGNPSLVSKVYVPRFIIVLSNNLANLICAALEFAVLLPLLIILGTGLELSVLLFPIILVLEFLLVFGISLFLSSISMKYRDFYQLWDIGLQLGFFLSPIIYDMQLVPARFRFAYSINPVTQLVEFARGILLFDKLPSLLDGVIIVLDIAVFLLVGFLVFRRLESRFVEEL